MTSPARRLAWAVPARAAAGAASALLLALSPVPVAAQQLPVTPSPSPARPQAAALTAPAPQDRLRIVLDDVDPTVPRPGEPVVLRGRIVNDSTATRRVSTLTVDAAWTTLTQRRAIDQWMDDAEQPGLEATWRLGQDAVGPVVTPGAQVPFTVTIGADVLVGLPPDPGVLALELETVDGPLPDDAAEDAAGDGSGATGSGTTGSGTTRSGTSGSAAAPDLRDPAVLRTVLVTSGLESVQAPLGMSWVVPLTLPPDPDLIDPDDAVRLPAWAATTGAGSPAQSWLEGMDLPGVTWLVDPALLVALHPEDALTTGPGEQTEEPTQSPTLQPTQETPGSGSVATEVPSSTSGPTDPPGGGHTDEAASTSTGGGGEAEGGGTGAGADDSAASTAETPGTGPDDAPDDPTDDPTDDGAATATPPVLPTKESVELGLTHLRGLLAQRSDPNLWWLPVDDPDLAAILELDRDSQVPAATRSTMHSMLEGSPTRPAPVQVERLLSRGRADIAWPVASTTVSDLARLRQLWPTPAGGPSDSEPASTSQESGLRAVLLPREAVTGATDAPITRAAVPLVDPDGLVALTADSRASALLSGAVESSHALGAGATVQRMLADSLTAWAQDPGSERSMLVVPRRGTLPSAEVLEELTDGIGSAPWVQPLSASSVLAGAVTTASAELTRKGPDPQVLGPLAAYAKVPASPLDPRAARRLSTLGRQLTGLEQIVADDSEAALRSWRPVLAGMWSTRWRSAPQTWSATWQALSEDVARARSAVHVNPSTVNFLSDQGQMRVTIVNDLPVAVEDVAVELVSGSSILQIVDQPDPVSIGPDSRGTVSFTARAVTRGQTTVTARLTAPNGTTLGDSTAIEVRVQPTGVWIYWVLGSIAGIVLVLGLVRAIRSTPRRAAAATDVTDTPGEERP